MKIEIKDDKTIAEIQEHFSNVFPNLRLEFFTHPHGVGDASKRTNMIDSQMKLRDIRSKNTRGDIRIEAADTVAKVESEFLEKFGLSVQVLRRSGKVWLVTTTSDNWTLREQNKHAEEVDQG